MKKEERLHNAQHQANAAKNELIRIADGLRDDGLMHQAEKLERIIVKLEIWQNSWQ